MRVPQSDSTRNVTGSSESHKSRKIEKALRVICEPGQVVELRALEVSTSSYRRRHTESGYFDDLSKLAEAAAKLDGCAKGIYITANPSTQPS